MKPGSNSLPNARSGMAFASLLLALAPRPQAIASESGFSGFVDAQLAAGRESNAAGIQDGALYFAQEKEGSRVFIDVAFQLKSSSTNDFTVFLNKGQAAVSHRILEKLELKLGQFDAVSGLERNDTRDIRFTRQGPLYATQPVTLTGLSITSSFGDAWTAQGVISGAENEGTREIGKRPEIAGRIEWKGPITLSASGTYRSLNAATQRLYVNATAQAALGPANIGVQLSLARAGNSPTGAGAGLIADYALSERSGLGARAEFVSRFSSFRTVALTTGPQYQLTSALRVKTDYTLTQEQVTSAGKSATNHQAALSAIYSF